MRKNPAFFVYVLALVATFAVPSYALDTDIYLTPNNISRDDSPNVLIIFDNSGSMAEVISSRPGYDPNVDYYNEPGSPKIATGRIYWTTGGSPPGKTTDQWFSATNNNCEASKPVLAFPGGSGIYMGVKILGFKPSGKGAGWRALQGGVDRIVDCAADNGATDPKGYVKGANYKPFAAYTSNASEQVNWNGITSQPTLYSANYMNYWHNTSLTTSQTRLQIAKNVVNGVIDANQNMRFGLMVFNYGGTDDSNPSDTHGGRLVMKIDNMDAARRTAMKATVNSLAAENWTPLAETLWEARRYLGGQGVDYGDNDPSASPARDTSAELGSSYISPLRYSCQKAFVIIMTDGDPTVDSNANGNIAALPGIGTVSGSYLDELAGWMNNNDINGTLDGNQTVVTFTISFGTGISAAGKSLLQSTANKGGGTFKTAETADELTTALQSAIVEISATTSSFVAPALSVNAFNRLFNRDDVYFAMFRPSDTVAWDGNVKKFKLDNAGDVVDSTGALAIDITTQRIKDGAQSYWSTTADGGTVTAGGVGAKLPAPAARVLYTYQGSYTGLSATTPANLTKIAATAGNSFYDAVTANPGLVGLPPTATATEVTQLVEWMLGADSYDRDADATTTTRWAAGDPLHSRPVAITYGGSDTAPVIKLFVATNDGVLHMFNDATGEEEWAFVPQEAAVLSRQYELSQDAPGTHEHLLDGTPTFWLQDANQNGVIEPGQDKIYMFIGQRRGGRNLYAFDVTPTTVLSDPLATGGIVPKLIWVKRGGVDTDVLSLGQTWSKPQVARIRYACTAATCVAGDSESKMALIFAGGYDPNQDTAVFPASSDAMGAAIYILDPLTGERLWWASGGADSAGVSPTLTIPGMVFSIPADLALADTNSDGAIDRVFVGDIVGQLWRIDLSPTIKKDTNAGSVGYKLADLGCTAGTRADCTGTPPQDRRRFHYPPEFVQVSDSNFSVTAAYDLLLIGSGDREDPLDRLTTSTSPIGPVHNRLYAIRDYNIAVGPPTTVPSAIGHGDLHDATANLLQDKTAAGYAGALADIRAKKGWFVDLSNSAAPTWAGEKALAKAAVFAGTAYFTTYVPANSSTAATTCAKDEGLGRLYAINVLNATAVYDYDNDADIDTNDRGDDVGGGIPSELVIIIRESGVSGLIGTSGGAAKPSGLPSKLPRVRTYWQED